MNNSVYDGAPLSPCGAIHIDGRCYNGAEHDSAGSAEQEGMMQFDDFVGQVQHRARLASGGEAMRAVHATLQTLGERLYGKEAEHLAAQLPEEIALYLRQAQGQESLSMHDFYQRVAERERAELPDAIYHARAVVSVLVDAVSPGEIADVRAQLPSEYDQLFQWSGEGGERRAA